MKEIVLSRGLVVEKVGAKQKKIYMHKAILEAAPGAEVDHWDDDGLNNQRGNLRSATRSENNANARKRAHGGTASSLFKGVYRNREAEVLG